MPDVKIKENDYYPDGLIRRFKKAVERSGLLAAIKNSRYYVKPSKLKQREKAAAIKRWRKKISRDGVGIARQSKRRKGSVIHLSEASLASLAPGIAQKD
jgi:small subunit ribosomal protein S21